MSAPTAEQLDPQPFREWAEGRFIAHKGETVALGAMAKPSKLEFATTLGIDDRQLDRWMKENQTLDRRAVEDAMHRAGYAIWDAYPDLPEPEPAKIRGNGPPPGYGRKLTDAQLRVLHKLHTERGFTVRDLGRRIKDSAGYKSLIAAESGIRKGWRKLGLEGERGPLSDHLRCQGTRSNGQRCTAAPMRDSDYCWGHDPARREEVLRHIRAAREHQAVAA